jgi:hypothetical protein
MANAVKQGETVYALIERARSEQTPKDAGLVKDLVDRLEAMLGAMMSDQGNYARLVACVMNIAKEGDSHPMGALACDCLAACGIERNPQFVPIGEQP